MSLPRVNCEKSTERINIHAILLVSLSCPWRSLNTTRYQPTKYTKNIHKGLVLSYPQHELFWTDFWGVHTGFLKWLMPKTYCISNSDIYQSTMLGEGKKHKKLNFSRCPFEKIEFFCLEGVKMMVLLRLRHFWKKVVK